MKNIFKATLLSVALLVVFSSCQKWEEYNTNPFGVTDEMLAADYANIGAYYPQIMQAVYYNRNNSNWEFQLVQNLTADHWAGYMGNASNFSDGVNTTNMYMTDSWISFEWDVTYKRVMAPIFNSIKPQADNDENRHFYAPALILQVYAMDRLVDMFGPCSYSAYGGSTTGGNFETVQDTYKQFFKDLDVAVAALDKFISETGSTTSKSFSKYDQWGGGDFSRWIRFANTLRMRLAMHIVKADPATAKSEFQKAAANSYGVLKEGEIIEHKSDTWQHPLWTLSQSWTDCYMGATLESLMTGYGDPREGKYFLKTTNAAALAAGQEFASIRFANDIPTKDAYAGFSMCAVEKTAPAMIMNPAEAQFLLAEAALRGWVSGSAESYYKAGVEASFKQHGVSGADSYLKSEAVPADYVNAVNPAHNIKAVNFLSPKWNEGDSNETKLERIIDQKYIALYPDGFEAWTELRRTGYPKLYPAIKNSSGGVLGDNDVVRRSPYPQSVVETDASGYQQAVGFLGGKDDAATRLWWDKKEVANF